MTQHNTLSIPQNISSMWQNIVDLIAQLLNTPSVMINRLLPPDLEIFSSNVAASNPFPAGTKIPMEGLYCTYAAQNKRPLQVNDARLDPQWKDSPTAKAGIFAYIGYPLVWPDGTIFGTLCTVDIKTNYWGKHYEDLIFTFKTAIEAHLELAFNVDLLQENNKHLCQALAEVKTLKGLLPICSTCKKIRDDQGYWATLETYISEHSPVEFSHGICPGCAEVLYPEYNLYKNRK